MPETAIRIQNFSKEYPVPRQKEKRVAVCDLTLGVPVGGLFGFLGPNGAGKTTTIKMLLGFLPPTQGEAWLFDRPVGDDRARQRVGYLPEQPYFPKFLSALEVVRAHAGLAGLSGRRHGERVEELSAPGRHVGQPAHDPVQVLQGHDPARRAGFGPGRRPRPADHGRAFVGPGPARAQGAARTVDRLEERGQDDLPLVPPAVRDGVGLRPGRRHGARETGRLRDTRRDHAGAGRSARPDRAGRAGRRPDARRSKTGAGRWSRPARACASHQRSFTRPWDCWNGGGPNWSP